MSPLRERRISTSSPRRSQGSYADLESFNQEQSPFPMLFLQHQNSTSSMNGHLTATSPEDVILRRKSSCSSSSSSSDEVVQIVDDDPDNDILETLDRKVSEVINRRRLNSSSALNNNNADTYGPLSFSYNNRRSPGSARRFSQSAVASASGLVRFGSDDEEDAVKNAGNLTDDSSADEHEENFGVNRWSDDDDDLDEKKPDSALNNVFTIKRKR